MNQQRKPVLTISEAAYTALAHANTQEKGYGILVGRGDLRQMGLQYQYLKMHGFDVRFLDVYPAVRTEDEAQRALRLLWEHRIDGWWNLCDLFLEHGVCTMLELEEQTRELDALIVLEARGHINSSETEPDHRS